MNIGRSAAVIQNAIQRITDKHPADPNTWLTILELLRPSVAVLRHSITENYLTIESLALNKKLVIAVLIETLQFSLVEAYCQLAYSLIGTASQPQKELVAIASHRAINYLSEILLQTYQVYSVPPKGLWQRLHTLYQLAETIQMTDYFAIHEIGNETVTKISIKDAYQRALTNSPCEFLSTRARGYATYLSCSNRMVSQNPALENRLMIFMSSAAPVTNRHYIEDYLRKPILKSLG